MMRLPEPSRGSMSSYLVLGVLLLLLIPVLVPRFLVADTFEDVARQRMRLNVVALGLEAYAVDERELPPWFVIYDALFANARFPQEYLTTPVDYVGGRDEVFRHVFAPDPGPQWYRLQGEPGTDCIRGEPFRVTSGCSRSNYESRTAQYLNCSDFDGHIHPDHAYMLWGAGPNGSILGAGPCSGHSKSDVPYDPTNGVYSNGQIYRFGFMPEMWEPTLTVY